MTIFRADVILSNFVDTTDNILFECSLKTEKTLSSQLRRQLPFDVFITTLQRITSELHLYYSKKDVLWFLVHLMVVDH